MAGPIPKQSIGLTGPGSPLADKQWWLFWDSLASDLAATTITGTAGAPGPFIRTFVIVDTAQGDNVADNVVSFGANIGAPSTVRRITGTLRTAIASDLVIRWNVKYPDGTSHIIGTFTLPHTTPLSKAVSFLTFAWPELPDLGVLIPDIVSSDGSTDNDGVAAWTIEWVGRGAGLATAPGLGSAGAYDAGTTYAKGDVVTSGGSGWISLADGNTGNDPATSPTWWTLLVSIGATGPVSSVGLTMPAEFSVAGSPVTSSGTLAVSKATQLANTVFKGPASGGAAVPTFDLLVPADIPAIAEAGVTGLVADLAAKVTHTAGPLTVDLPVLGAGAADTKIGTAAQLVPTLPADATKFLDGTGAFTVPAGGGSGTWIVGSGVPAGGTGSNGDMYLNSATGDIYGPKTAGAWGAIVANIEGPAGSAGATGATGPAVLHGFGADFYNGGVNLTAGLTAYVTVPVGGTISAWNLLVDAGVCTVTVWKIASGTSVPAVGNSISTAGLSISSGTAIHSTTLSDFTTLTVANHDVVAIHLASCAGVKQISFGIEL